MLAALSRTIAPSGRSHGELCHKKSRMIDHHKHYELYDGLEVALKVRCPIELLDRRDEWEWLCGREIPEKSEGKLDQSVKEETSSPIRITMQRTEEVQTLTSEVASLNEQIAAQNNFMNQIRRAPFKCLAFNSPTLNHLQKRSPSPPPQQLRPFGPLTQQQHHQPAIVTSWTTFF
ncbi:hypothetical protein D8674_002967 [Pyrus ussuriensis x Pyrus communis]|uniref:Uncharacterized protein n=1 Tax=Pyrus ussuriensis x Pyrus communis TaxID=2448454 RepID=A0A5N5FL83_9ROSA|nr:hypothetical protein D8674_002967 [Pyrus ussuriensis x Pyrus communis]